MTLRLPEFLSRSPEEVLRRLLATEPPPPPHYCGRCMVLFITRGDYILHVCGGPPGECLGRIDREPFGVVYPGGWPIVTQEDMRSWSWSLGR